MTSANYTTSSSWVYYHGSPGSSHSIPRNRSQQSSPSSQPSNISFVDVIENEHSLQQYLQDYENFERTAAVGNYCLKRFSCFLLQNIWKILIKTNAGSVCPVHSFGVLLQLKYLFRGITFYCPVKSIITVPFNIMVEWLAFMFQIREVMGSDLFFSVFRHMPE